jgi:hypothetical protein
LFQFAQGCFIVIYCRFSFGAPAVAMLGDGVAAGTGYACTYFSRKIRHTIGGGLADFYFVVSGRCIGFLFAGGESSKEKKEEY